MKDYLDGAVSALAVGVFIIVIVIIIGFKAVKATKPYLNNYPTTTPTSIQESPRNGN